jgi:protein-S-isoprenylcysteine O-methyltransferase Ste14
VLLFIAAGTLRWTGAWIFLVGMGTLGLTSGLWLARRDPALIRERLGSPVQEGQPTADKVLVITLFTSIAIWLVIMGLDVRFGWSMVAAWLQGVGALLLVLSTWIILLTMRANSFAAPVVKIQTERGHSVISSGPYGYVRHPMYSGAMLYFIGTALLLGSWWGVALTSVFAVLLIVRIPIEERTLRAGLPGYDDYAARVRYRLIPFVW